MAWRCLLAALLGLCAAREAWCVEFPYVAYVNSADVYVRSGPGRNYYPTDKLQKGMKVEIYRHDPGSWVTSRHLDAIDNRVAVVNSERVVARVGSAFSDARDVIQVRLDKGEKVELIAPAAADSPWYRISPPAGEFRWVFAKFVHSEDEGDAPDDAEPQSDELPTAGSATAHKDVRLASAAGRESSERSAPRSRQRSAPLNSEQARAKELEGIDLALSAMVVEEVSTWSFADLKQRAERVLQEAQTGAERGQARGLIDKLARFDDIKQRSDAVRRGADGVGSQAAGSAARRALDPRFDGVGRLAPVVSQRIGAPQYALVDGTNAVVSFITPAPGVNLRPYVDKYIGVNGQRAYMNDLQRQHINVQRVTLVDVERR
jgi:SH3-like domain-containing protein